jgi:glycosyltransferase involved in cell wall biosynthesis
LPGKVCANGATGLKILIISDAGRPQINGVVRTLECTARELIRMGHAVEIINPDSKRFLTVAMPFYPEIKLEFFAYRRLAQIIDAFQPDCIHIATEGPLGCAARKVCMHGARPFTTSYHTRFPEYFAARVPRILAWAVLAILYALLRRFHAPAAAVMVATASIENALRAHKFHRLVRWSRGVDGNLFYPRREQPTSYQNLPRPLLLYVGRVAIEKNLREFLDLQTAGSLVVIGDGPDLPMLAQHYPHAHFLGVMKGENLAQHYAAADLFVFPSTTDTFGLVLLEAAASGLRIAAKHAPGPSDIFADMDSAAFAVLDDNLGDAINRALALPQNPALPHLFASRFSWTACTLQFVTHLQAPSPMAKRRLIRWRRKIGAGI